MPADPSGPRRGPGRPSGQLDTRTLGRWGEDLAEAYLRRRGCRILARNLHLGHAELDLLALDGSTLCFVEVRLRRGDGFGAPEESLDWRKQRRLRAAARQVLASGTLPRFSDTRFDLIAIDASKDPPALRHLRGVLDDRS
jgi:putative endonuclease